MPRRKAVSKKQLFPDPLFGSELIARFINVIMRDGKKSKAEKIVYGALEQVLKQVQKDVNLQNELFSSKERFSQDDDKSKGASEGEQSDSEGGSVGVSEGDVLITKVEITEFLKLDTPNIRQHVQARKIGLLAFKKALSRVSPFVEVKSRRVGGSNYQVPQEVRPHRRKTLGMRWLGDFAGKRGDKTMMQRLAGELADAALGRGGAVKKRDEVHRMAEANKAFAHYRW